ncbi:nitrilase-related carbon-nitrogen hydrolase [Novosphingobium resinovorum]
MTRDFVKGAGESQVVGPDGAALVRATHDDIGLVFADIDLSKLEREDRMARRRPELYTLMGEDNAALAALAEDRAPAGKAALTTIVPDGATFDERLAQAVTMIASAPAGLAVLPEFFAWALGDDSRLDEATAALVEAAAAAGTYLVAGLPGREHGKRVNRAVLFGPEGVIGEYRQIHADPGSNDMALGDDLPVFDLPFGRLGLLLGEDLLFPEAARVLARKGADLIACPATWREDWHHELMLTARSAENHVTIVSAGRADSLCAKPGTVCTTPPEYRFPQTKEVNAPDRHIAPSLTGAFTVEVDLAPNRDKRLMGATDLIMDTRPELYGAILALRESVPA